MTIDKLNLHYSFTTPATVHDEEAMTSLELAGRQGAKINEIIEDQNQLHEETSQALENYENKLNTEMPTRVTSEVNRQINSGAFDDTINRYYGDLEGRVNNLAKLNEGSTTGDAELIDARTDHHGNTWTNAGEMIRESLKTVETRLDEITHNVLEQLNIPYTTGWYGIGTSAGFNSNNIHIEVPVKPNEKYVVKCSYGWDMPAVYFLDKNKDPLIAGLSSTGSGSQNYDTIIYVPDGASYMWVQCYGDGSQNPIGVQKYTHVIVDNDEYMKNVIESLASQSPVLGENIANDYLLKGKLLGRWDITNYDQNTYTVAEVPVQAGERYRIKGTGSYTNQLYTVMDNTNGPIIYVPHESTNTYDSFDVIISIPSKGAVLRVAGYDLVQAPVVQKVLGAVSTENNLSHIKWVCLGDSLTEANIRTTKHYHTYVQDKTGINVVNMGLSGTGYKNTEGNNTAFYQRALNIPTDADVVTIFGSGNDLSHTLGNPTDTGTSTICGCVNKTIENILSVNPTVKIGIVAPTPWQGNTPKENGSMARYTEALKQIAEIHGLPFLDLFHESGLRPNDATFRTLAYSKDDGNGVHPDEKGHKMISGQFYVFIQKLVGTY